MPRAAPIWRSLIPALTFIAFTACSPVRTNTQSPADPTVPEATSTLPTPIAATQVIAATRAGNPIEIGVEDATGRLVRARGLDPAEVDALGDAGVHGAPGDPASIWVTWSDSPCESRGRLSVGAGGVIELALAPRPACDAIGTSRGVELGFSVPVDPAAFRLVDEGPTLVTPSDLLPVSLTFGPIENEVTWIGGTSAAGDALVFRWSGDPQLDGLGRGSVVDLEYVEWNGEGAGEVLAVVDCDPGVPGCRAGLYVSGDSGFARVSKESLLTIAASREGDAVGIVGGDHPGMLASADAGATWLLFEDPCEAGELPLDAAVTAGGTTTVLCASAAPVLMRSAGSGENWTVLPTPSFDVLPTAVELAPAGDSGWLWAAGSRSAAETSDGRTWIAVPAQALPKGTLLALDVVEDAVIALVAADHIVRLVRWSPDAETWSEIATWPT